MLTKYVDYLQEHNEILTFNEYVLITNLREKKRLSRRYRELEPLFSKSLKMGLIPALITAAGASGAGVLGGVIAGYFSAALIMYPMWLYRKFTDICSKQCRRATDPTFCYNKCYYDAVVKVITAVKREIANTSKIKDTKKRERAKQKLAKELNKWQEKEKRYKERLATRLQRVKVSDEKV